MNPGKHWYLLALAVIGLVAPVANAEDLWWFDHRQGRFPTTDLEKVAEPNLWEVGISDKNSKLYGPCEKVKVKGTIYNHLGGMASGTFGEVAESKGEGCPTSISGCKVKKLEPIVKPAWNITLQSNQKVLITNFKVKVELEGTCEGAALPGNELSGTVEEASSPFISFNGEEGSEVFFEHAQIGTTEAWLEGPLRFGTEIVATPQISGFKATESPATIKGSQLETFVLTRSGRKVECSVASLSGTGKSGEFSLAVKPVFSGCKTSLGPATIKMNNCEFLVHSEPQLISGEKYTYTAPTDVKCPPGGEAEIDVYSSEANHKAGTVTCRYKFGESGNQLLGLVELANKAPGLEGWQKGWVEAAVGIGGIDSKRTVGPLLVCGAEFETTGTLTGKYQITGETAEGQENGIAVLP